MKGVGEEHAAVDINTVRAKCLAAFHQATDGWIYESSPWQSRFLPI